MLASDTEAPVERAFLLILGRSPSDQERERTHRFLRQQADVAEASDDRLPVPAPANVPRATALAWTDLCLALYNSNAFVYLD